MRSLSVLVAALAVLASVPVQHVRAAAQSDCQTAECQRAKARQEGQCQRNKTPVSQVPARLAPDRNAQA